MKEKISFHIYYYPFSYEDYGTICTEVRIYLGGSLVEVWQSNKLLEDEEMEELKKQKAREYGISELSESNN